MDVLTAVLAILVAIAILFEIARRLGVPYPTLLVLGGLGLAFVPGLARIKLDPDLVLLVFLPPLLFSAAAESPIRDLRANRAALVRLSIGLVIFTMVIVGAVAHAAIPGLSWAAALTLGAIVGPTDALAATTVFRRLGAPRTIRTLIEGEALFNDATALVAYRAAVLSAVSGTFVLSESVAGFFVDRTQHLATEDPDETAERRQERLEHEQIQQGIIAAQRTAVIELRDRGEINDQTLRAIERELDLEELRMEG